MRHQTRQKKILPIFSRPSSQIKSLSTKSKAMSSVALPDIYTRQLRHKIPEVKIQNHNDLRTQICKIITFKRDRVTVLQSSLYQQLPQQIQAISYNSPQYRNKLQIVNKIFGSCDLSLKEKDIMIAEGKRSQAKYVFVTNFSYHPHSLCCDYPVILKCIEKKGIQIEQSKQDSKRWQILCIGCGKIILKVIQNEQIHEKHQQNHHRQRKLLDFALYIASGRYKKHLMQEDPATISFEHVKSRFTNIVLKKASQSLQ